MMRRAVCTWMVWLAGLALVSGCGGGGASGRGWGGKSTQGQAPEKVKGDRTRVSTSEGVEPVWIQECPVHTDYVLAFCGEAHRRPSEKTAYTEAYADALGKLKRFIGQKVEANLEPDGQGGYRFQIRGLDDQAVTIRGAWEGERWCEEYQGPDGRTHDCWMMISYPRLEYDTLVGKAREIARQRMAKALELHDQARELSSQGRHAEAAILLERAQGLLAQIREPEIFDGKTSAVLAEEVAAALRDATSKAKETGNTALVVVGLTVDGELQTGGRDLTNLQNTVQKWLSSSGIKIRPGGLPTGQVEAILAGDKETAAQAAAGKGAGVLVVLDLHSKFKSEIYGQFFYLAEGGLRVIRTADGRELYTAELPSIKEGHVSRQEANTKALTVLMNKTVKPAVQTAVGKIR